MKVVADVRYGNLVIQDERWWIESAIGRQLQWEEVEGTRQEAGAFSQADYEAEILPEERELIYALELEHSWIEG